MSDPVLAEFDGGGPWDGHQRVIENLTASVIVTVRDGEGRYFHAIYERAAEGDGGDEHPMRTARYSFARLDPFP